MFMRGKIQFHEGLLLSGVIMNWGVVALHAVGPWSRSPERRQASPITPPAAGDQSNMDSIAVALGFDSSSTFRMIMIVR